MTLTLHGPFSFIGEDSIFESSISKHAGLYLWTVRKKGKNYVFYVGETGTSFSERLKSHLEYILSGGYRIFNPDKFSPEEMEPVWNPFVDKKGRGRWAYREEYLAEFLSNYSKYSNQIIPYIRVFNLFFIPLSEDEYRKLYPSVLDDIKRKEKRVREILETALVNTIKNKANMLDIDYNNYEIKKNIEISIHDTRKIEGLEKKITIEKN